METGKIATLAYQSIGIPDGASSTGQFGDILTITIDGVEYEYQVQPWDSPEAVKRAFEKIIEKSKQLVAA